MTMPPDHDDAAPRVKDSDDSHPLKAERREKLAALRQLGGAFPNDFNPTHHAGDLHQRHGPLQYDELEPPAILVRGAGRRMVMGIMGLACFATLQDGSAGSTHGRLQL